MAKIERLEGQIKGRGFIVPVSFERVYYNWINTIADDQCVMGASSLSVVRNLIWRWIENHNKVLEDGLGITQRGKDAKRYSPVTFKNDKTPDEDLYGHQRQPLQLPVWGKQAYFIDAVLEKKILGNTRSEVARRMVESQLFDRFDDYSKFIK